MAHLTNISFEFFYKIFTEDASLPLLYHGAKQSKTTGLGALVWQPQNGSCQQQRQEPTGEAIVPLCLMYLRPLFSLFGNVRCAVAHVRLRWRRRRGRRLFAVGENFLFSSLAWQLGRRKGVFLIPPRFWTKLVSVDRLVCTRYSCHSHGNLALLCIDRAKTVQIYLPIKKEKIFFFSVSHYLSWRNLSWSDGQMRRVDSTTTNGHSILTNVCLHLSSCKWQRSQWGNPSTTERRAPSTGLIISHALKVCHKRLQRSQCSKLASLHWVQYFSEIAIYWKYFKQAHAHANARNMQSLNVLKQRPRKRSLAQRSYSTVWQGIMDEIQVLLFRYSYFFFIF